MEPEIVELIELVRDVRALEKQYSKKRDSGVMYKIHYIQNQIDARLEKIPVPEPKTPAKAAPVTQGAIF